MLGVGNSQWPGYQAFPRKVDEALGSSGAQRLCPRGEANGDGDFEGGVTAFLKELWSELGSTATPVQDGGLELERIDAGGVRASALPEQTVSLEVIDNFELVASAANLWDFAKEPPRASTRMVTLSLPSGAAYAAGDHVAIYARNRPELIDLATRRLGVAPDAQVVPKASGTRFRHLPIGRVITVVQLLADFVDLGETLSRRALEAAISATSCPPTRAELTRLSSEDVWRTEVVENRLSLLALLQRHPAIDMDLSIFVEVSPAIAPRFYSIASSPSVSPRSVDLIVGTTYAPAWSGVGVHEGLASSFLRDVRPGTRVFGHVRRPTPTFAPPQDGAVPLVLIGPGTGFAPLRGFLQERAAMKPTAPCHLFVGARHPDHDLLCREEIERWEKDGVVELHAAYSQLDGHPHRYVQDALWAARTPVREAVANGGQVFVCGDDRFMAPAVRDMLIRIYREATGGDHGAGAAWLEALIEDGVYHQDVFGFSR